MRTYRLYFMNSASGHIDHFDEFEAADDQAAQRSVDWPAVRQPAELWQSNRKVRRFEPQRLSSIPSSQLRIIAAEPNGMPPRLQ